MQDRRDYIDVAKGLGILLVVLGHNLGLAQTFAFYLIFSFHMPLFFFLSGMVFNPQGSLLDLLAKKFRSVLLPFFSIVIIIHLMLAVFSNMKLPVAFKRGMTSILFAGGIHLEWIQLWYLPHLFLVFLFAYLFIRAGLILRINAALRCALLGIVLVVGYASLRYFWPLRLTFSGKMYEFGGLPYSLDLILITGFFFLAGYELARVVNEKLLANWALFIIATVLLFLFNYFSQARVDIFKRIYDSIWVNTLEAFSGIFGILALSVQISIHLNRLKLILTYLGRVSLFIFIFHWQIEQSWYGELLNIFGNTFWATFGSLTASVLASVLIFEFFIKENPVASHLFGQKIRQKD